MRKLLARTLMLAAAAGLAGVTPAAQATAITTGSGYFTAAPGVQLHYSYAIPSTPGSYPTLFEYSGYNPGEVPDPGYIAEYVPDGYAYIGLDLRGTGCSGGTFDFFEPQEAADAANFIDNFIALQPWSNGQVAMIGKSYPGITQLFTAEQQPKHLVAIAPGHPFGDVYRDVAFPGGILNYAFASLWSLEAQPTPGRESAVQATAAGDATCAANLAAHEASNPPKNPILQALQHPYDDSFVRERSDIYHLKDINVPVFTTMAWQDEQLGSRNTDLLQVFAAEGKTDWWAILTNGDHGMYRTPRALRELHQFYDYTLKGLANGWASRAHVEYWWESTKPTATAEKGPSWVTSGDIFNTGATAQRLFLENGGGLGSAPPVSAAADAYVYPGGTDSQAAPYDVSYAQTDNGAWQLHPAPGTALSYTTDPLPADEVMLGNGSADLWLASSAVDTDLQVTLSEIRPDGQEQFVQQGWLRASHRALDASQSTDLRPYQTHQQGDATQLVPGQVTPVRVEIFPFGQPLRKDSRLRVTIEAPEVTPSLWGFALLPIPATNLIYHDAAHPSSLALPLVSGITIPVTEPACGTLIRQPCR